MNMDSSRFYFLIAIIFLFLGSSHAAEVKAIYQNNFDKAEVDKVPEEFLVIDGGFVVKEESGNKFLELPGAPLDTFRVLFGPTTNYNVAVSAKIFGTAKGRRSPTFAVGLSGVGGYRLQVSPAKKLLELYKGDDVIKTAAYEWKSGEWSTVSLAVKKTPAGKFILHGKAWAKTETEPKEPQLTFDLEAAPSNGRPSVWGSPYSGTPIRFDDLTLSAAE
jgi:hypothetical protein